MIAHKRACGLDLHCYAARPFIAGVKFKRKQMSLATKAKYLLIAILVFTGIVLWANYVAEADESQCSIVCQEKGQSYIYEPPKFEGRSSLAMSSQLSKPSKCFCVNY